MADQFTAGETFTEDEQVTHAKLNLAQTNLKFTSAAVDGSTTAISSEAIIVKSGGITATQLATDAVETVKIDDGAVIRAKIAADAIDGTKLADNAVDSEHYTDASIDPEHLGATVISAQPELSAVPHLTQDEVLISDNGVLKKLKLMTYLPLPRAFGIIVMDGSAGTGDALGLYGCTCTAYSGETYTFDLTTDMSSANYPVIAQSHNTSDWSSSADNSAVEIVDAGQFKIHTHQQTSPYHVSFVVFGTLAT
jgi:hypothetical protein